MRKEEKREIVRDYFLRGKSTYQINREHQKVKYWSRAIIAKEATIAAELMHRGFISAPIKIATLFCPDFRLVLFQDCRLAAMDVFRQMWEIQDSGILKTSCLEQTKWRIKRCQCMDLRSEGA